MGARVKKTTLEIDSELLRRAKRRAADDGTTLKALVEDGLRRVLAPSGGKAYRYDIPVIRGSRPPAVDIADRKTLYDFMDDR